jgi:hypothetical protein
VNVDRPGAERDDGAASGAAFFTADGRQITTLWVLGDVDGEAAIERARQQPLLVARALLSGP